MKESTTITSIQRKYYALAAKGLGLCDTKDGIRAGSESVPVVSQAVFAFSGEPSPVASSPGEEAAARRGASPMSEYVDSLASTYPIESESRKRRREESEDPAFSRKPPPSDSHGGGDLDEGPPFY